MHDTNITVYCVTVARLGLESLKEPNSLHLTAERFSPVRRASDGLFGKSLLSYQAHLEKLYNAAISRSQSSSLKQLQHEHQQLQVRPSTAAGTCM